MYRVLYRSRLEGEGLGKVKGIGARVWEGEQGQRNGRGAGVHGKVIPIGNSEG